VKHKKQTMAQSNMMGKLADRVDIIKSGFSEMEKAVIKATKHNTKPPKEKHVRRLIVYNHEQSHRIGELINLLAKRLEIPDWIVVMKTLITFHRLLKDSRQQFISEMRYRSAIFNLRRFADMTSPEAHHQSIFVRKYSQYLEEKVLVYKIANVEFEKDTVATKNMTVDESFEKIPRLQSQLNALLNCRASKDHINNNIIATAFTLLLKDSFKLYSALNDGIINILENYFNMLKPNATKALEIYRLFTKETDGIIQFFEISKRFSRSDLPELQHAPTTLVEALEAYIKDLDDGKSPNTPNTVGTVRNNMVKAQQLMNQQMEDFKFDDDGEDGEGSSDEESKATEPFPTSQTQQPKSAPPTSTFDPFGGTPFTVDPFGSTTPPTAAFDPFTAHTKDSVPTVTYDAKKKQIETLMTTSGVNPTNTTPLVPHLPPSQPVTFPQSTTPFNSQQPTWNQPGYNNPFFPTNNQQPNNSNNSNPFA